MQTKLSHHFTWKEATKTSTGLPNTPVNQEHIDRISYTALQMEIVRAVLGRRPITVNSWYRSPAVNKAVGGVPTSEHAAGAAVDFTCSSYGTPYQICQSLIHNSHILNYNQLIYEGAWVHISFPPDGIAGKNEVLTMKAGKYYKGLVS